MRGNFKAARKEKGYTQEEVAEILGVSQRSVSNWETGAKEPDFSTLVRLADMYGVTADYLLEHSRNDLDILTDDERDVLNSYRSLNEQGKEYIRQTLMMALSIYKKSAGVPDVENQQVI